MYTTPEQFSGATRSTIEASVTLTNTAFACVERLTALNLELARSILADSAANAKALFGAKNAQDFFGLQTSLAQPVLEKTIGYSRSVYELGARTNGEFSQILEAQVAETNKNILDAFEQAAKAAPAGSGIGMAALKSAVAAGTSAYAAMNKAAKGFVEMAEANVASATSATAKAVGAGKMKKAA
jgi:phasin family protein